MTASRTMRDQMTDGAQYASDFAMLSLLINLNRIPTNMAFFAEKKTALRNYHPVPVLQTTNGHLQDVPRIRLILKAANTYEDSEVPPNPAQLRDRTYQNHIPSTTITNLLFILANYNTNISENHSFPENFDFLDMFMPAPYSSESRARVFLYLCYFYLERPGRQDNPFDDPTRSAAHIPPLVPMTLEEMNTENVETEKEMELVKTFLQQREDFVKSQEGIGTKVAKEDEAASKRKRRASAGTGTAEKTGRKRQQKKQEEVNASSNGAGPMRPSEGPPLRTKMWAPKPQHHQLPPPRVSRTPDPTPSTSQLSVARPPHRRTTSARNANSMGSRSPDSGTLVQHAFLLATQSDPLVDSDEEPEPGDQLLREDYENRLWVLSRLRW